MELIVPVLVRLVALCAFSAVCELSLTGEKLLACVRVIAGLLVMGSILELIYAMLGMLRI